MRWRGHWLAGVLVLVVGCSSSGWSTGALEKRHELVERHVFGLPCEALLPLIDQLLWDQGYRDVEELDEGFGRETDWVEGSEVQAHQRRVDIYYGGAERCAVRSTIQEVEQGQIVERRDRRWEWELLREVEPEVARQMEAEARAGPES